eukprot:6199799-Pleurochrysis_carterae.AAC.1
MDSTMFAVAVSSKESQDALYKTTAGSCATQDIFSLPIDKLRVGTMDSLMSLGDDLHKMDTLAESTAFKIFKQLDELKREDGNPNGAQVAVNGSACSCQGSEIDVSTVSYDEFNICFYGRSKATNFNFLNAHVLP